MRTTILPSVVLSVLVAWVRPAVAEGPDAGDVDAAPTGQTNPDNPEAEGIPLACDGALCDTTNMSTITDYVCSVVVGRSNRAPTSGSTVLLALIALGFLASRRIVRRRAGKLTLAVVLSLATAGRAAFAGPPPPVDVTIPEAAPQKRTLIIAWNPLSLILTRPSFDVIVTPKQHHTLVVSAHYFWVYTASIFIYDDQQNATQLPRQNFEGGGGEIGYRYYFGERGPRGWFLGPAFLLSSITATAQNGDKTAYLNYGGALDGGYQMLVADRVAVNLGMGIQYTSNDKNIPKQQFPALMLANDGLRPRFLLSLGIAL